MVKIANEFLKFAKTIYDDHYKSYYEIQDEMGLNYLKLIEDPIAELNVKHPLPLRSKGRWKDYEG
jgi:hypothetical protein